MTGGALPVWELMQTAHVVGRRFTQLMDTVDLTPTQFAVLMYLQRYGGTTQAELARQVLVRPQSIGVLLESLIERGLVVRDGPGGRGRRAALQLTDDGLRAFHLARGPVEEFNEPSALGLSPAQSAMLSEILGRIRDTMDARPNRPHPSGTRRSPSPRGARLP